MQWRRWLLLALLMPLSACNLLHLGEQMQQVERELMLVPGRLHSDQTALVVLLDERGEALGYRVVAPGALFYFSVERGDYQLLAFVDSNVNFRLDPGEPRHWRVPAQTVAMRLQPSAEQRAAFTEHNVLSPQPDTGVAVPATDLSLGRLYREHPRLRHNYLQVVDFDDPRFDQTRIQQGAWRPLDFVREIGYGLYLLRPWQDDLEPVILIHGIKDSPRSWRELAAAIDPQRFQVLLYQYPSGSPLNNSAYLLSEALRDLQLRYAPKRLHLVAHSMGGLVARRTAQLLRPGAGDQRLCLLLTLATPWGGHPSAATGAARVPVDVPVWRDMAPGSPFLQELFADPLPAHIRQWQLVAYAGNNRMIVEPNDGSVPLASQLLPAAQDETDRLYLVEENHTGIMRSARSQALLRRALASLPETGCASGQ